LALPPEAVKIGNWEFLKDTYIRDSFNYIMPFTYFVPKESTDYPLASNLSVQNTSGNAIVASIDDVQGHCMNPFNDMFPTFVGD